MQARIDVPPEGMSARTFAERVGLPVKRVQDWCLKGWIIGARQHPLTRKWWIYPPGRFGGARSHWT